MDRQEQQTSIKDLIAKGKEQGFLTYAEVNDHLPEGIVEPEQIEDIIRMINDMGIKVHESAPTESNDILSDTETEPDEDAAEEAAAALASLDSEFGRTTDPVRMYIRTGSVVRPNSLSSEASAAAASSAASSSGSVSVSDRISADSVGADSCTLIPMSLIMRMMSSICSGSEMSSGR